ncbi:HipA domain-containing protein [mine drainage metagenome]|uniref:HipA domain-containing protein n=1 Tax=mine drainage metagenome TaxID=410659 RepID=T0Y7B7_9ZZZZ
MISPAYDLNPTRIEKRTHDLSFDGATDLPDLELCLTLSAYFRYISESDAKNDLDHIREGVSKWRDLAKDVGLDAREILRMEKAFEMADRPGKTSGVSFRTK